MARDIMLRVEKGGGDITRLSMIVDLSLLYAVAVCYCSRSRYN
jgi:hypothetical protein